MHFVAQCLFLVYVGTIGKKMCVKMAVTIKTNANYKINNWVARKCLKIYRQLFTFLPLWLYL